ncbi:hypothetical protein ACJIZ3_015698 [Penstemon smallii]|uniref:Uncharacterized protein n=1 Tax=Penstemon smallii TaxID=265156 RepID=A0ABD3RN80_9LAMI
MNSLVFIDNNVAKTSNSMDVVSAEEPELPGAGAGATSLAAVGAPATELGDTTANGERAAAKEYIYIYIYIYMTMLGDLIMSYIFQEKKAQKYNAIFSKR